MALTAKIDTSKTPAVLTVTSDKRERPIKITLESAGETAVVTGAWAPAPVTIAEATGVGAITVRSDDGKVLIADVAAP